MRSRLNFKKVHNVNLSNEISPFGYCSSLEFICLGWGVCAEGWCCSVSLLMDGRGIKPIVKPKVERILAKRKQYMIQWSEFYLSFEMEPLCPDFGVSTTASSL